MSLIINPDGPVGKMLVSSGPPRYNETMTEALSGTGEPDFGLFFENLEVSALVVDHRGRVLRANRSARRFFHAPREGELALTSQSRKAMIAEGTEGEPFPLQFTSPDRQALMVEPLLLRGRVVAVSPGETPDYYLVFHSSPIMDSEEEQAARDRDLRRHQGRIGRAPLSWVLDTNFRYISFNDAHRQEMKRVWGVDIQVGMNILDCLSDLRYRRLVTYNYNRALSGEHFYTVDELKDSEGNKRYFENIVGPYLDEYRQLRGIQVQTTEMTDPTEVKDRLQLSIAMQRSLIEGYGNIGICCLDRFHRYRAFNDGYRRFMEEIRDVKIRIGLSLLDSLPGDAMRHDVKEKLERVFAGERFTEVRSYTGIDGRARFYENRYYPVVSNGDSIVGITIFIQDVTGMKTQERAIREAVRENEILLKEIHFRVKNNLQVVSSLLNLQMNSEEEPGTLEALRKVFIRIRSLALIHEQMFQDKTLGGINARELISRVLTQLVDLYDVDTRLIRLEQEAEDFEIGADTALPLGMILSELITNALKHGFSGGREGVLSVRLTGSEGDWGLLTVADSGSRERQIPETRETGISRESFRLGLNLCESLTDQLGGRMEFDLRKGTEVRVTFRMT